MDKEKILDKFKERVGFEEWGNYAVHKLEQILNSLSDGEGEPKCEECGADKHPVGWVCLECEWTYPEINSASGYPNNLLPAPPEDN